MPALQQLQLREMACQAFQESIRVKQVVQETAADFAVQMADVVCRAFRGHHRLFVFGNGGSAADAQHLAAEFINRFQRDRPPLPALALTVDTSVLTSIGNDYSFDDIFRKQLQGLAQSGDVALGISTSGHSTNILRALQWARENGLHTIGWAGADQTDMDIYCDLIMHVPSGVTARIQETHITMAHILCALVEEMLFSENPAP
jgi:D-sedoheptulose 7-phosphate isomerase